MNGVVMTTSPYPRIDAQISGFVRNNDAFGESGEMEMRKMMEEYEVIREVGQGGYSRVYLAREKKTGRPLVLKKIRKSGLNGVKVVKRMFGEKEMLSKLRHPLIVDFYHSFQDSTSLYLALEFVPGGDFYTFLSTRDKLLASELKFYVSEIASVLIHLHQQGIVYRDLKQENVLISSTGHIKLTDFGLAKRLLPGERTFSLCGTPHFMAPETITRGGHGVGVDWWSLGVLMHEALTMNSPFDAPTSQEVYTSIVTKEYQPPEGLDSETTSLLLGLLTKDWSLRLKDEEVMRHPFFKDIDWNHLDTLTPAYIPAVKGPFDTSHFDHYQDYAGRQSGEVDQSLFVGF